MTTPSYRPSGTPLSDAGPPQSILQKLLEEINGAESTAETKTTSTSTPPSRASPKPGTLKRAASVWVPNSPIAQDASAKLRALDEARQRNRSLGTNNGKMSATAEPSQRRPSLQVAIQNVSAGTSV